MADIHEYEAPRVDVVGDVADLTKMPVLDDGSKIVN
jgi:hypothetical protein